MIINKKNIKIVLLILLLVVKIYAMKEEVVENKKENMNQPYAKKFNATTFIKYLSGLTMTSASILVVREYYRKGLKGIQGLPDYFKKIPNNTYDLLIPGLSSFSIMGSIAMVNETFKPREINIENSKKKWLKEIDLKINSKEDAIYNLKKLINNSEIGEEYQKSDEDRKKKLEKELREITMRREAIEQLTEVFNTVLINFHDRLIKYVEKEGSKNIEYVQEVNKFICGLVDNFNKSKDIWEAEWNNKNKGLS